MTNPFCDCATYGYRGCWACSTKKPEEIMAFRYGVDYARRGLLLPRPRGVSWTDLEEDTARAGYAWYTGRAAKVAV